MVFLSELKLFLFLHENIRGGYSLEVYAHMFYWRNKKKIYKYFKIPILGPLLGLSKRGLISLGGWGWGGGGGVDIIEYSKT